MTLNLSERTTGAWAGLARQYLARRDETFLRSARAAAAGDARIVRLLDAYERRDLHTLERIAEPLALTLGRDGRHEEALTVRLLDLDPRAALAEQFNQFPIEQRRRALELGLESCEEAIALAAQIGDEPCWAFFLAVRGNGLREARDLHPARAAFDEALPIYRRLA
jgi:hypothetical protein